MKSKLREIKFYLKSKQDDRTLIKKSNSELMSLLRHEAHRIEKSQYNNVFDKYKTAYEHKCQLIIKIIAILSGRDGKYDTDPSVLWALDIVNSFDDITQLFIEQNSKSGYERGVSYDTLYRLFDNRRSCRVWSDEQPNNGELELLGQKMVQAAITAPSSGNRQGLRFKVITEEESRFLFKGIKEKHTYTAPMLIFTGVDKRLYFAYGKHETSFYVDGGAAVQNMVTSAQTLGLDSCWNHFTSEFISSRKSNIEQYELIKDKLNIPDYIEPIAILAVGKADYIPPKPERMTLDSFFI